MTMAHASGKYALLIVAAIGIFLFTTLRSGQDWDGDFALYIMNARNIVEGMPYAGTPYIPNPQNAVQPAAYPVGLPMVLAPIYAVFGAHLLLMKAVCLGAFVAFLALFRQVTRERLPPAFALATIAAIGLHPYVWAFKDSLQSEFVFILFCYIALRQADRLLQSTGGIKPALIVATGVSIAAAWLTRSAGVVLFPAVLAAAVYQARGVRHAIVRNAALALGCAVAVGSALQWMYPADVGTYAGYFEGYTWETLLDNINQYRSVDRTLFGRSFGVNTKSATAVDLAGLALFFVGFITQLRRRLSVYEWFFAGSLAMLLIYPINADIPRYTLPLWPLLFLYMALGLQRTSQWLGSRVAPRLIWLAPASILIAVASLYFVQYRQLDFGPIATSVDSSQSKELFTAIKTHVPQGSAVLTRKPAIVALYTNRQTSVWPLHVSNQGLWDFIDAAGIEYIVQDIEHLGVHSSPNDPLDKFIRSNLVLLERKFSNDLFILYRIRHEER